MIERSQYKTNRKCYGSGEGSALVERVNSVPSLTVDSSMTLLDYFLSETEKFQAQLGRYSSPEEHAFYDTLIKNQKLFSRAPKTPSRIKPNRINTNEKIKYVYLNQIIGKMCKEGDDPDNYGSTCSCDIAVLQAISKRIHYGKFVAEAKFIAEREKFTRLIEMNDAKGLMDALTYEKVEKMVVNRVKNKASHYGTDGIDTETRIYKVDPELIAKLYEEYLIPLNKEVQVQYLLQRLDRPTFAFAVNAMQVDEKTSGKPVVWENRASAAGKLFFGTGDGETENRGEHLQCSSIDEVFQAVITNKVPYGIVPIEHPLFGLYKETQVNLCRSSLKVFACVHLRLDRDELVSPKSSDSFERYFVIGRVGSSRNELTEDVNHIVAVFLTKHEPGALLRALKCLEGLNLCCLESLPGCHLSPMNQSSYIFYCEIERGTKTVDETKAILEELESETSKLTIVGYYCSLT